jgi:predicted molibdopterin-dependent oxidoreductase YjgC
VFGAGGGTSSYREIEEADVVLLWGSNARETHPIFFHHVLRAVRRGAKLYVIDPRRTTTAEWADGLLQLNVGTDIALANGVARCILEEGLEHQAFIHHATEGFEAYAGMAARYRLPRVAEETGVDAELIRRMARDYARANKAIICWTLGITEHHNAVDNVLALINLGLLTGHVGRWGSGLNPLRGQNNVQGGGDMGALPNKLPGFQDVEDGELRARFEAAWGRKVPAHNGWHLTEMFEAMERKALTALHVIGENPAQSEAESLHTLHLLEGLEHLVVQDIVMTRTAELADVVLPASASWCEAEGTVTNSERRVQRCRPALKPPGSARDDIEILSALSRRLGYELGLASPEAAWNELRSLSPMHRGMSYARLEALGGLQWPCPDEDHPGSPFLHSRLWEEPLRGRRAPFIPTEQVPPVDALDKAFPLRLTTGRRLQSFNTGVQSGGYAWPHPQRETLDLSPADAHELGVVEGEQVRVVSRRGAVEAPVRIDPGLPAGLAFMTFHFPSEVDTNVLTINATDPKSGTAEFKASAIRVEKLRAEGGRPVTDASLRR